MLNECGGGEMPIPTEPDVNEMLILPEPDETEKEFEERYLVLKAAKLGCHPQSLKEIWRRSRKLAPQPDDPN